MSRGWRDICPVCGNYEQDGICLRCNANAATRTKRWRRGDKGGVRPERRNYYKPETDDKRDHKRAPTSKPAPVKPVKRSCQPDKGFLSALQGIWTCDQKKLKVNIDLATNRWVFTFSSGKRLTQIWHPETYSSSELRFTRNGKEIIAWVGDGGVLMMTGKSGPVPFVNIKSGKKYRLCRVCHTKSPWRNRRCRRCRHRF